MATTAIHTELVSDMTASAFIAAFRRFIAHRGHATNMYGDNETNFVWIKQNSSRNEMMDEDEFNETINQELNRSKTIWHFSPSRAPQFNGLAEAVVKSVELHLNKTISDTILFFEL